MTTPTARTPSPANYYGKIIWINPPIPTGPGHFHLPYRPTIPSHPHRPGKEGDLRARPPATLYRASFTDGPAGDRGDVGNGTREEVDVGD